MRSEVAKRILSETPDEVRERVKQYAKQKVMEQQKIEQMKSVIAEYMGYKSSPDKSDFVKTDEKGINDYRYKSDLKYHSDMNWLYPVYCKIIREPANSYNYENWMAHIEHLERKISQGVPISELHEAIYNAIVWLKNNK